MTVEQLRKVHRAAPFERFTIHTADGRSFHIPHPEFLAFTKSGRTVIVSTEDDTFEIVDLLLVTTIEVNPQSPSSA